MAVVDRAQRRVDLAPVDGPHDLAAGRVAVARDQREVGTQRLGVHLGEPAVAGRGALGRRQDAVSFVVAHGLRGEAVRRARGRPVGVPPGLKVLWLSPRSVARKSQPLVQRYGSWNAIFSRPAGRIRRTLLALGEPTHGESAFLQLRNEAFLSLAEHGYRSIAVESDRAAGLIADEFVQGAPP